MIVVLPKITGYCILLCEVICTYTCCYNEKTLITLDGFFFDSQLICHPILLCLLPQMSELIAFLWTLILQVTPETPGFGTIYLRYHSSQH